MIVLSTLAVTLPAEMGKIADPLTTPEVIKSQSGTFTFRFALLKALSRYRGGAEHGSYRVPVFRLAVCRWTDSVDAGRAAKPACGLVRFGHHHRIADGGAAVVAALKVAHHVTPRKTSCHHHPGPCVLGFSSACAVHGSAAQKQESGDRATAHVVVPKARQSCVKVTRKTTPTSSSTGSSVPTPRCRLSGLSQSRSR